MAKQNKKTSKKPESHGAAIGVGLTTAAVAAAGAYFLYGSKSAVKNRKMVQSWALKAKAEVLEKLEDAKEMTQDEYEELVGSVAKAYSSAKTASQKDIKAFATEMTDHWKQIEKAAKPLTSTAKRKVKKVAKQVKKSASKKVAKKAAKKVAKKTTKKK
jgi:hypothetical protein